MPKQAPTDLLGRPPADQLRPGSVEGREVELRHLIVQRLWVIRGGRRAGSAAGLAAPTV
jgi:hypothetical protein